MSQFKISVLWAAWTPQVQSRVVRDVLAMQRLARQQRCALLVACDQLARANVEAVGAKAVDDFNTPDVCMVYLVNGKDMPPEIIDRLPPEVEPIVVSLFGDAQPNGQLVIEKDPYAGVKLYEGVRRINETMPLDKRPPKGDSEPIWSPYL
jgi:hypothetical protein